MADAEPTDANGTTANAAAATAKLRILMVIPHSNM